MFIDKFSMASYLPRIASKAVTPSGGNGGQSAKNKKRSNDQNEERPRHDHISHPCCSGNSYPRPGWAVGHCPVYRR